MVGFLDYQFTNIDMDQGQSDEHVAQSKLREFLPVTDWSLKEGAHRTCTWSYKLKDKTEAEHQPPTFVPWIVSGEVGV